MSLSARVSVMPSVPRVLVLGSCRVSRPLRQLRDLGLIDYVNLDERIWFTHTSAGARQTVGVLQGAISIPDELWPAALETHLELSGDISAPHLTNVDVAVIEISSLRRHSVGGFQLNAHKVYGEAVAAGIEAPQLVRGNTEALPVGHPLKSMTVSTTTYDDLATDLLEMQATIAAPVLTVDHLYSEMPDGTPVPEREKLSGFLRRLEAEHGIPFYSTKPAILSHGIDKALTDQNHYRPEFESVVADRLYPLIAQLSA